jgi:putative flavoprotein involved in K+ transport
MDTLDVLVIGAGQAGLAAGFHLKQTGLRYAILDAAKAPGGSWRNYYDSLVLFSPARYSSLEGMPFGGDPDHYPARDEVVAYLQNYASKFDLPVIADARVIEVTREEGMFRVTASSGGTLHARSVIAATGSFGNPYIPDLSGQSEYRGRILHAFDYRNATPFEEQRIVVVGGANSAVQIGVELARVARVTLALRSRIFLVPQHILGKDGHFWLRVTGLDKTRFLSDQSTPVVDAGHYRRTIKAGRPDTRRMFTRLTERGVIWRDGTKENVDTIILATGYRPSLQYLSGLAALDSRGLPRQRNGVSTSVPGLYYVGLSGQRNFASATLRGVSSDAGVVVNHLLRETT